ncbi:MAG: efflux RND transporter periplasmic adaptor subunit [Thermoguttaceae bacterium]|jgi:cobalt-zinc-cadmium efflux system membrane fusion protein
MRVLLSRLRKTGGILLPMLAILSALAVACGAVKLPWTATDAEKADPPAKEALAVELVAGKPNSLLVPEEVQKSLGIRTGNVDQVALAEKPTRTRPLVLPGSTALDPARLIRVRVRFAPAEVTEIGKIDDPHGSPGNIPPLRRELQAGDPVKKGDLLAVLFSVDVGNKKNDLFDALSQLRLDEEVLKRAEARSAAVPEVFLLGARRNVQADNNAVNRAENTLKTWAIPEEDIQAVRDEVKSVAKDQDHRAKEKDRLKQWARVELKAPDDGFIIEQNVALHETVVDNTTNLFQMAKVDPLIVLAAAAEDDLPALQDLKSQTRNRIEWTVRTVGAEPIAGLVDDIGYLIDPNQHTAIVRGHIPNPNRLLRAGQFVTATVELLPPRNVVEVPISAVVEDGKDSIVFVQTDPQKAIYTMRRVQVTNRFERTAYVRSVPVAKDEERAPGEEVQPSLPKEPLGAGERVLTAGALELKTALANKLSEGSRE